MSTAEAPDPSEAAEDVRAILYMCRLMALAVEEGEPFDGQCAGRLLARLAQHCDLLGRDIILPPEFGRLVAQDLQGRTPNARKGQRRPFYGGHTSWLGTQRALLEYAHLRRQNVKGEAIKAYLCRKFRVKRTTIERWISTKRLVCQGDPDELDRAIEKAFL